MFRAGDRIAAVETKGFLAGWAYDLLKSQGAANRRFEYEIVMDGDQPAVWLVRVNGKEYPLSADSHAGIFLTGAYDSPAEALEKPFDQLSGGTKEEEGQ